MRVDSVPLGMDLQSWVLTSDGNTMHNGEVITKLNKKPVEGDILVSWRAHAVCSAALHR